MTRFWDTLQLFRPGWGDMVEILLVSALLYRVLLLIHRTRAMQMLLGVLLLGSIYLVAQLIGFQLIERILQTLFQIGAIAALVIFQPELRSALARLGQSRMLRPFTRLEESQVVDELVEAVDRLARSKIGAILAIEREVSLDEYAEAASPVEARVSAEMLHTIFTPYSPLHDGAVLIAGGQIRSAGAILPLTQFPPQDRSLGTRHRAALGLSEETDAVVIVVSEETSRVSVAQAGRLERDVGGDRLREILSVDEARPPALFGRVGG
ncbi:MAG: diadenylate cyclase CdaA [Gemmatimonadetes bacterium]|nr:diadenylate cyclase CdaA [Gemmatimonadota bacterium]MBT8405339.1 diadenylate cyclase CdaA [Gemmatimonadota bacterium]NNF37991.1 TIGR00159 family protein [Gemmatimonadota bacterium]